VIYSCREVLNPITVKSVDWDEYLYFLYGVTDAGQNYGTSVASPWEMPLIVPAPQQLIERASGDATNSHGFPSVDPAEDAIDVEMTEFERFAQLAKEYSTPVLKFLAGRIAGKIEDIPFKMTPFAEFWETVGIVDAVPIAEALGVTELGPLSLPVVTVWLTNEMVGRVMDKAGEDTVNIAVETYQTMRESMRISPSPGQSALRIPTPQPNEGIDTAASIPAALNPSALRIPNPQPNG
jgi:hypothetical protein